MNGVLELRRTIKESITPDSNVIFNEGSPFSDEISYDITTGDVILTKAGKYSIRWWVATETTLRDCMKFAVKSSQNDILTSFSPIKKGQVVGFGTIEALSDYVTLSLVNIGSYPVVLSQTTPDTAILAAQRIPDDGVIPSFDVNEVLTLQPGEDASADVQEDVANPNKWLFTFGIPMGNTGAPGVSPHIDTTSGNWFVGETDTNVHAQGVQGPKGDTGPMGTPEYYNFSITSSNTTANPVSFNIGSIRFEFSYYNATTYQLRYYPVIPGTNILYDLRRLGYYDNTRQVETRNGVILPDTGWIADDTIYSQSNEWQSTYLRQKNPDGTWSLCEYNLFGSVSLGRITLWVNWIYKDITITGW